MTAGLIIVLVIILFAPFIFKKVETNLEIFLFLMGLIAVCLSGSVSIDLFKHIIKNEMLYFISAAVLIAGIIFKHSIEKIRNITKKLVNRFSFPVFLFLLIVFLGLISSVITAIIASLILVEVVHILPIERKYKIKLCVISCFSIGLGAALTPIGEPLSTIVISALDEDFFYLFRTIGLYVIPGVIALGFFGAADIGKNAKLIHKDEIDAEEYKNYSRMATENYPDIFFRAGKVFLFVVALELLGAGFKPLINAHIINLDSQLLYWINMISAVLDNATLAAAEISPLMAQEQIISVLMGLLISGGMLVPGNIPNIVSSCKLNIKSVEWAMIGLPIGATLMIIYFLQLFVF